MASAEVRTPTVEITDELIADLVRLGGYTHPLFAVPIAECDPPVPLPGQAVLLLMGGLVEQSRILEDAVALLELRHTRFQAMAIAGTQLSVVIYELDSKTTSSGRLLTTYQWTAVDAAGKQIAETQALMLRKSTPRVVAE